MGSNAWDSFTKAWELYFNAQHMLVDQELEEFLQLKGSGDWFTMKYTPSEKECVEFRKIVFNNLLCMFFFELRFKLLIYV